ncbi:MAG: hypothetical protein LC739_01300 [Actinobacteria bacterium]|nr:hypothetical protein [Actinomycetota bacterium]
MSARGPALAAASILGLVVGGVVLLLVLSLGQRRPDIVQRVLLGGVFGVYGVVGALIVSRRPGNRVGWLFSAIGTIAVLTALADLGRDFVETEIAAGRSPGPAAVALVIYGEGFWYPFFGLFLILVPLTFPTGRALSWRWAWVGWIGMLAMMTAGVLAMLQERFGEAEGVVIENPIGIPGLPHPERSEFGNALLTIGVAAGVLALISVVVRFRRADRVERLQLKWLTLSCGLLVAWILIEEIVLIEMGIEVAGSMLIFSLVLLAIPVSAGLAILRYRLFEIDRLISRTVTYSLLVLLLAALYIGGVFALTRLVPVTSDLAVAASTLVVAAVFKPLRDWIHGWVDRRFNRSRYDASRLFDSFASRLRTESDLPQIMSEFQAVVTRTIEPVTTSVWVRGVGWTP